jgi:hypothetical protein
MILDAMDIVVALVGRSLSGIHLTEWRRLSTIIPPDAEESNTTVQWNLGDQTLNFQLKKSRIRRSQVRNDECPVKRSVVCKRVSILPCKRQVFPRRIP